jgi:hypothetical protein
MIRSGVLREREAASKRGSLRNRPVCHMLLSCIAVQQLLGWSQTGVQCVGRQDETTVLGDKRLLGRDRRG